MRQGQGNGAVLYVRVSTDEQASGPLNLTNQEQRCRDFCKHKGWPVLEVFVDAGESARSTDRPEFQRLLTFCKRNRSRIRYVVVQDLSRWTRNLRDQSETMADLLSIGIRLRSASESSVDETAEGKLAGGIFGTFAEYYSNSLAARMKVRTRDSVAAGRFPWCAPLGYENTGCKEGSNIKPDALRAPFIRQAFELIATGIHSKAEVLKSVTNAGLTTRSGKALSKQTFQAMMRNPLYSGWVTLPSDPSFAPVRGLHEPIVNQEIFDRVQAILDGRKPSIVAKAKINPVVPLRRFVKCNVCGTPLTGGSPQGRGRKKYPRYWCPKAGCHA